MIQRIRGRGFKLYAWVLWTLAVVVAGASLINGGVSEFVWTIPPILLFLTLGWAVFWNPRLEIGPGGLRVVNIVRQFDVPWEDFEFVERHWGLYIHTKSTDRISAWSVPSSTGLLDNSWINEKTGRTDPPMNWQTETAVVDRTMGLGTVADGIEEFAQRYRQDRRFREATRNDAPDWPRTTMTRANVVPLALVLGSLTATVYLFLT